MNYPIISDYSFYVNIFTIAFKYFDEYQFFFYNRREKVIIDNRPESRDDYANDYI